MEFIPFICIYSWSIHMNSSIVIERFNPALISSSLALFSAKLWRFRITASDTLSSLYVSFQHTPLFVTLLHIFDTNSINKPRQMVLICVPGKHLLRVLILLSRAFPTLCSQWTIFESNIEAIWSIIWLFPLLPLRSFQARPNKFPPCSTSTIQGPGAFCCFYFPLITGNLAWKRVHWPCHLFLCSESNNHNPKTNHSTIFNHFEICNLLFQISIVFIGINLLLGYKLCIFLHS